MANELVVTLPPASERRRRRRLPEFFTQLPAEAEQEPGRWEVDHRPLAQHLARLRMVDPERADRVLREVGGAIDPTELEAAGLRVPPPDPGLLGRGVGAAGGALAGALRVLDFPSQVVLHGLRGIREGRLPGPEEVERERLNLRAALGHDPRRGGRTAGIFDLIGTIALDPLTYITLGAGAGARGVGQLVRGMFGDEVAEQVARQGARALTPQQTALLRQRLVGQAEEAGALRRRPLQVLRGEAATPETAAEQRLRQFQRQAQGGVRWAGQTVIPGHALARLGEVSRLSRARDLVRDTKVVNWLGETFIPRFQAAKHIGRQAADEWGAVEAEARAMLNRDLINISRRVEHAVRQAVTTPDDYKRLSRDVLVPALDVGGDVPTALAHLQAAGHDAAAHLLQTLDNVRLETYNALIRHGIAPAEELMNPTDYIKRILSPEGAEALGIATKRGLRNIPPDIIDPGGALRPRKIAPEAPIRDIERTVAQELRDQGVLPVGADLYQHDAVRSVLMRAEEVHRDVAQMHVFRHLSQLRDEAGDPFLHLVRRGETLDPALRRPGWVEVDLGRLGKAYVDPALATDVRRMQDVVMNDRIIREYTNFLDRWQAMWKGQATVVPFFGVGFHSRNLYGNLFNNFLAGVTNPRHYAEAWKLQRKLAGLERESVRTGRPIREILEKHLTPREKKRFLGALDEGVIDTSFFAVEMQRAYRHLELTPRGRMLRAANPLSSHGFMVRSGAWIGRGIEHNTRLAHYLAKIDQGMNRREAAQSAKRYLFDYADLTAFERLKLRRVMAFYTFARKNTALQVAEILRHPGKYAWLPKAHANMAAPDEDVRGRLIPHWAREQAQIPLSPGLMGGLELTLDPAMEMIDPAVQIAAQVPGLRALIPEEARTVRPPHQAIARAIANLPAGGPIELGRAIVETAAGRTIFAGRDLRHETPGRMIRRYLNAISPQIEKAVNLQQDLTGTGRAEEREIWGAVIGRNLLGVRLTPLDDRTDAIEARRIIEDIQHVFRTWRQQGVDVPTISELRRMGLLPPIERAPARPRETTQEILARWRESGVPVPEGFVPPLDIDHPRRGRRNRREVLRRLIVDLG